MKHIIVITNIERLKREGCIFYTKGSDFHAWFNDNKIYENNGKIFEKKDFQFSIFLDTYKSGDLITHVTHPNLKKG